MDEWNPQESIDVPSDWRVQWNGSVLTISMDNLDGIDLGKVRFKDGKNPTFTYGSIVSKYSVAGYTLNVGDHVLRFTSSQVVKDVDFGGQSEISVYASWNAEYILVFYSDPSHYEDG